MHLLRSGTAREKPAAGLARASTSGDIVARHWKRESVVQSVWFVPLGWVHAPRSALGWLVTLAAVAYATQVFLAIVAHAHSVTDTLYAVYPPWGVTFLGWDWIARRTAGPAQR